MFDEREFLERRPSRPSHARNLDTRGVGYSRPRNRGLQAIPKRISPAHNSLTTYGTTWASTRKGWAWFCT